MIQIEQSLPRYKLENIWDEPLDNPPEPIKERDYLYASEIGSSFLEVYLKMRGVQPTNYPTKVARRKMEAGKVWEGIVRMVLKRAGILRAEQHKVDFALPGLLPVHGRLDFIAGGVVDIDQMLDYSIALKLLWEEMAMPQIFVDVAQRTIDSVVNAAYNGKTVYQEEVSEVKSVALFVWDMIEGTGKPAGYHTNQIFHYSYGLKKPVGRITYICREDTRLKEMDVANSLENLTTYTKWVSTFTDYWNSQEEPPREDLIGFNPIDFKFRKKTMEIEWSRYLTLIYGFKSPQEYRDLVTKPIGQFNRVFAKCVEATKKITPANLEIIKEAKKYLPNWDDYVDKAKAANIVLTEESESD